MTSDTDSKTPPANDVASDLTKGIESCRAVVRDYRAKLASNLAAANLNEDELPDQLSSS